MIDSSYHSIHVPANWFTQSINGQSIDFHGKAWYVKRFRIPSFKPSSSISLVFEGVDYEADVWLNGHYLGKHTGYFAPFQFDIPLNYLQSDSMKQYSSIINNAQASLMNDSADASADNILTICVHSPREREEDWSLRKRLIKGIFGHHDTRPGGAWSIRGQEQNTGGIWGNVYLAIHSKASLPFIAIEPLVTNGIKSDSTMDVKVRVRACISSSSQTPFAAALAFVLSPYNFTDSLSQTHDSVRIIVHPGENILEHTFRVRAPHLWYSSDVGTPNLYTLRSILLDSSSAHLLDARHDRIGLRSIHCDEQTKQWFLNGRRIFLRGTNYIGTQWLSSMKKADYEQDISLMLSANINALRVHAHITSKSFYDLCDEAGIMVWQDFPLQWGYTDEPDFVREASRQTREMVRSLYNHPSIIAWCLHNEPPFDADWMVYKYPDYYPLQNKALNTILTRIAHHEDSSRYVHPYSATKEHHWQGWYAGTWRDHARPTRSRMITEFGAQALPVRSTLELIVGSSRLFPRTEEDWAVWEFHNFQRMEAFQNARIPMGTSTDEFIAHTQEYQSRLTKLAAESYRRQKYAPVGSIFQFMFVEHWASINWGIVDYRRKPKPAYYVLQQAYKPATAMAEYDPATHSIHIWVVNDLWKTIDNAIIECTLSSNDRFTSASNNIIKTWNCKMFADSVYKLDSWQLPASIRPDEFERRYTLSVNVHY